MSKSRFFLGQLTALLVTWSVAGCAEGGVAAIEVVTAPGSTLLDRINRVEAHLLPQEIHQSASRGRDGTLTVDFEFPATGQTGVLSLVGYDSRGLTIAVGQTPPLPLDRTNTSAKVYMAPPHSVELAPAEVLPPRSRLGSTQLTFGFALAGGQLANGAPVADAAIYSAYSHSFITIVSLPEPRAGPSLANSQSADTLLVFGGEDATGVSRSEGWSLQMSAASEGAYVDLRVDGDFTRADASTAALSDATFIVAGAPAVVLGAVSQTAKPLAGPTMIGPGLASAAASEGRVALAVGETRAHIIDANSAQVVASAPSSLLRTGHALADTGAGSIVVVGGRLEDGTLTAEIVAFDTNSRTFWVPSSVLAIPRDNPAIATAAGVLIVAGGRLEDGSVSGVVEVFRADTLAPLKSLALAIPRSAAVAHPLPNGQVAIVGGFDADGEPIAEVELFTPEGATD